MEASRQGEVRNLPAATRSCLLQESVFEFDNGRKGIPPHRLCLSLVVTPEGDNVHEYYHLQALVQASISGAMAVDNPLILSAYLGVYDKVSRR